LARSTRLTPFFSMIFVMVTSLRAIRATTVGIGLSPTHCMAELPSSARRSSCEVAPAFSRTGGMIVPILAGILLMTIRTLPASTSFVVLIFAARTEKGFRARMC
ncbi:hypothetical protein BKA70DRAFT_1124196, partial [Coprinopsis sp. MPI-PUGE-AT-0042]